MSNFSQENVMQKAGPNTEKYGPRYGYGFLQTGCRPIRMQDPLRRLPTVGSDTTGFIEIRRCPHESRVESSWAAIKLFKVFNFKNNYFCRYFRVSTDKKTVVLP